MGNYVKNGYHSTHGASWRRSSSLVGQYIGVEFEVESAGPYSSYRTLLELLPDFPEGGPITEHDGSLSYERGVEIIFPPVPYDELKKPSSVFHQCIKALDGKTRHTSETGMHLNVNRHGWSPRKRGLFVGMIHNLSSDQLFHLGNRYPNDYSEPVRGMSVDWYSVIGSAHSYAAELPNYRVEIRFPQSTTDTRRINMLVDFVERLEAFVDSLDEKANPTPRKDDEMDDDLNFIWDDIPDSDWSKLQLKFQTFLRKTKKGRVVADTMLYGLEKALLNAEKEAADKLKARTPAAGTTARTRTRTAA